MNDQVLERRMLLRGAGLAGATALGGVALASPASADDHHHDDSSDVLGAWLITHMDDPPGDTTPTMAVAAFAEGGVLTTQDISPVATAGLGAWESSHHNRFKGTFWTGSPAGGPQEPAATVKVQVRGKTHDDKISGTYRLTVYDPTQTVIFTGTGTFSGKRIEP